MRKQTKKWIFITEILVCIATISTLHIKCVYAEVANSTQIQTTVSEQPAVALVPTSVSNKGNALPAMTMPKLNIQQWKTDNGVNVLFLQTRSLPMVDIVVMFDAGSARDSDHYGVAALTNSVLSEGAGQLTADQIAEQFDKVGSVFNSSVSRDLASLSLRSLTDPLFLTPALETFTAVLAKPTFPKEGFLRQQALQLQALKERQQDPDSVVTDTFFSLLYGKTPYGHATLGNEAIVNRLMPQDVKNFYNQYYVSNNATLAIVGDLTQKQADNIARKITDKLAIGTAAPQQLLTLAEPTELQQHINFPATQTYAYLGELGIARKDSSYFPLLVGNYILGGGPDSRLFTDVRIKNALSYSVGSQFVPLENPGPFVVSIETRNENTQKAIALAKQVLADFVENGVTDDELMAAKQFLIASFPSNIASNSDLVSMLSLIGYYRLPLDYLNTYQQKVAQISKQNVTDAFKAKLNLKELLTVTVGPQLSQTPPSSLPSGAFGVSENSWVPVNL